MKNKTKVISIVIFLSVLIMLVSCKQQKTEWKGTIEEEDGVTVVKNPKEPMYGEDVFSLEEELSFGEAEGREEYMFSEMRHIAVDEDERIYILDWKENHIKVFDKDGEYLMTIGRKGQGPGELDSPNMLTVNQNALIVQQATRRLSFFSLEGKFLRDLPMKGTMLLRARVDSKGDIVVQEGLIDPENLMYLVKKYDPELNLIAEIASSPIPDPRKSFNPFMPIAYWLIDKDDNIVYGYPEDYEIQIYSPKGKLIKKITKEYDPVEIIEEEKEEQTRDAPPQIIFVQTWEKIGDEEIYYHDVFDPEGKYIVKIPLLMRPFVCKLGKLYTIEEDEEGFQMVKRYKVTWNY